MKASERKSYVLYRIRISLETLEAAEILIENKKWNSAVNRLYYAAYYSVSALLVQNEIITKTHAGVKTQFFLHYIKTGKIKTTLGKTFSDLFDSRQKGDYGDFIDFAEEDVEVLHQFTKELTEAVNAELEL